MESKPQKQSSQQKSKVVNNLLIAAIITIALFARLYKIDTPLADWHSWRQADTVSVANEYVKHGIDILHPTYMDLSDIPSGKDNLQGYRMVEFPLISAKIAYLYNTLAIPSLPLHVFYRLSSILFSLGSLVLLYLLVSFIEDKKVGLLTAFIFAILPYSIFYSRTTLPENPLVFFSLAAVYALVRFFNTPNHSLKTSWYWVALLSSIVALLLKPTAIFFALPALYYGFRTCRWNLLKDWKTYFFGVLAFAPLIVWRWWIGHYPEGIPAFDWLLNGNGIRFKGAFFRWIFADRIGRLILGYWGVVFLSLGLLHKTTNEKMCSANGFFGMWALSMIAYLTIFATGNVQHDYYQIILIPIISIYVARGMFFLWDQKTLVSKLLALVSCSFMLAFSWYEVRGYYNINNPAIVAAGEALDQIAESDALVIAPYMGDTAFLYQTNRRGWPVGGQIEKRIEQGADYYITTSLDDEAKTLIKTYLVVETNSQYTIIDLRKSSSPTPTLLPVASPTPSSSPENSPRIPPGQRKKLN